MFVQLNTMISRCVSARSRNKRLSISFSIKSRRFDGNKSFNSPETMNRIYASIMNIHGKHPIVTETVSS